MLVFPTIKFHSILVSPITKFNSILVFPTTKFHSILVSPTTRFHSTYMSPTTAHRPPMDDWGPAGAWQKIPLPKLSNTWTPSTNWRALQYSTFYTVHCTPFTIHCSYQIFNRHNVALAVLQRRLSLNQSLIYWFSHQLIIFLPCPGCNRLIPLSILFGV